MSSAAAASWETGLVTDRLIRRMSSIARTSAAPPASSNRVARSPAAAEAMLAWGSARTIQLALRGSRLGGMLTPAAKYALFVFHLQGRGDDLPVELVLRALVLEVADEHPREQSAEEEADGNDARGSGEEAKPQVQVPASSNR